jgi:hypothetical protein
VDKPNRRPKRTRSFSEQVDTEQHSDLLAKFGVDPQELATKFGGGLLG